MAGINKAILVGRLGKDPEIKYMPDGRAIANFTMATSETFKNKEGQKQERTEWHRIVAYGKLAEICSEYLTKGKQIYIEGKIQTRSWDDKSSGIKKYSTEIIANTMQMLGNSPKTGDETSNIVGDSASAGEAVFVSESQSVDEDVPF